MSFEDERIVKEIRNNVNRLVNCETANLQKTIKSSVEQIENIKLIKEKKKFKTRPIFNTWSDRVSGTTIALNDIWATEVKITNYRKIGKRSEVTYQVTFWDHFGLDISDMEKK